MKQQFDFILIRDFIGRISYDEERNLYKVDDVTITPPKRIPEETSAYEYPFEMPSASRKGWAIEMQGNWLKEREIEPITPHPHAEKPSEQKSVLQRRPKSVRKLSGAG
jgi:hypothetical protein